MEQVDLNNLWSAWEDHKKRNNNLKYWTKWMLPPFNSFVHACRKSIAAKKEADILECLDPRYHCIFGYWSEKDPRNAQMFQVFLHCSSLGIKIRQAHATEANLKQSLDARLLQGDVASLATELSKVDCIPVSFLWDLLRLLLLEGDPSEAHLQVPLAEQALSLLLYDESTDKGVVADLKLALIHWETSDAQGPSTCELYPSPLQALIARDARWRQAENNAGTVAKKLLEAASPPARCAIRWSISMRGDQTLTPLLAGDSVGGAFALGISNLLSTRGAR